MGEQAIGVLIYWIFGGMRNMEMREWSRSLGVRLKEPHQFQRKEPPMVLSEEEARDLSRSVGGCRTGMEEVQRIRYPIHRVQCYFLGQIIG